LDPTAVLRTAIIFFCIFIVIVIALGVIAAFAAGGLFGDLARGFGPPPAH
jgi:hypothetical protein